MNNFIPPTLTQLVGRIQNDVKTELPQSNPWLQNSWIRAMIIGYAGRFSENYLQINAIYNALFLATSMSNFLDSWGVSLNLPRLVATAASGFVTATGTPGSVIAIASQLQSDTGILYTTQAEGTIATQALSTTLSRIGNVVTATTISDHNLASGLDVTISDAVSSEYNGTFEISVIDNTSFTYTIVGTPATPDSGTTSADIASLQILSSTFGADTNQVSGAQLTFSSLITGVATVTFVQNEGIDGGEDVESDTAYDARLVFKASNPGANNSVQGIENTVLTVSGVTRVFVRPGIGTYTVYFVRDNDANILPTTTELQEVKDLLIALNYKVAVISDDDVKVLAPTPVNVVFTFASLTPNNASMQSAVAATLDLFFKENSTLGVDIPQIAYESAIFNTVDPTNGQKVTNFSLVSPVGDIAVAAGELAILSGVNF